MAEATHGKTVTKKKRNGRGAFTLGVIIICLAAVGIVFLISSGVSAVKKLTDKTQLKNRNRTQKKNHNGKKYTHSISNHDS